MEYDKRLSLEELCDRIGEACCAVHELCMSSCTCLDTSCVQWNPASTKSLN